MSMNIYVKATIDVSLPNGKKKQLTERFELCQTPTEVSYQIEASKDKLYAYLKWLRETLTPYEDEVYAEDDIFQERPPIRMEIVDLYPEKEQELRKWISEHENEGWKIEWYVM